MKALKLGIAVIVLATAIACPIQRPPVPQEYYEFRAALEMAVADTATFVMLGDAEMRERLDSRLPELAAITSPDSLIALLDNDPVLWMLASPLASVLQRTLRGAGGRTQSVYRNPDGQRLAVDAVIIGLGKAIRRSRAAARPPAGAAPLAVGDRRAELRVEIEPAHGEYALHRVTDLIVGCRGAGRQADLDIAVRKPTVLGHHAIRPDDLVGDPSGLGIDAGGVLQVVRPRMSSADLGQVVRVA